MFRFAVILPVVVFALAAGAVMACGGDDNDASRPAPSTVSAQPTQPTSGGGSPSQSGTGGIRVTIIDFGYGPDTLTARAGQELSLNVTNNGQAPHTFTITGVVDSGTLNNGQSKTIAFTPAAAGVLQFFCTIHGAATMSGRITVQ
jgi:plastocyanin